MEQKQPVSSEHYELVNVVYKQVRKAISLLKAPRYSA